MSGEDDKEEVGRKLFAQMSEHQQHASKKSRAKTKKKHDHDIDPDYRRDLVKPKASGGSNGEHAPIPSPFAKPQPSHASAARSGGGSGSQRGRRINLSANHHDHSLPPHKRVQADNHRLRPQYEKVKDLEGKVLRGIKDDSALTYLPRLLSESRALMADDCAYATSKNMFARVWKATYTVLEDRLRRVKKLQHQLAQDPAPEGDTLSKLEAALSKTKMLHARLLNDTITSYHDLLTAITAQHPGQVQQGMQDGARNPPTVLSHQCLIALGDLNRYGREWTRAEFFYKRALMLVPDTGKAHNQLAVVAHNVFDQKEGMFWLTVVYRYFRSIAAVDPFPARENLISFFEKNRKRVEALDKERGRNPTPALDAFLTRLTRLYALLFTRISLETFDEVCARCLERLDALVLDASLGSGVLVRMFVCHAFLVHDAFPMDAAGPRAPTLASSYAVALAFDCATHVMQCACKSGDRLLDVLPALAVFGEWCLLAPALVKLEEDSVKCFWEVFCAVLNMVREVAVGEEITGTEVTRELAEVQGFTHLRHVPGVDGVVWEEENLLGGTEAMLSSIVRLRRLGEWGVLNNILYTDGTKYSTSPPIAEPAPARRVLDLSAAPASPAPAQALPEEHAVPGKGEGNSEGENNGAANVGSAGEAGAPVPELLEVAPEAVVGDDASQPGEGEKEGEGEGNDGQDDPNSPPREEGNRPQFAMQVVSESTRQREELRKRLLNGALSAQVATKPLVVIDAPNVAMRHGKQKEFSSVGIRLCAEHWQRNGHKVIGFLPDYYLDYRRVGEQRRAKNAGFEVGSQRLPNDVGLLNTLVQSGVIVPTPAYDYDDSYCIQYAYRHGGFIVTNDRYRDYQPKRAEDEADMRRWIREHTISYTFVGDEFLPNPDFHFPEAGASKT